MIWVLLRPVAELLIVIVVAIGTLAWLDRKDRILRWPWQK